MKKSLINTSEATDKIHPWRLCPFGMHYVRTHEEHIPPSKKHPDGSVIERHDHCARNPSHKDMMTTDEILAIGDKYFSGLTGSPTAGALSEFSNADHYDELIRGWVRYWNDIFKSDEPLDPNLIKALMATESSFNERAKNKTEKILARGLLQITQGTLHILADHNGELSNYLLHLSEEDLFRPSANICVGIRWLFRKKITATARLHRPATWEESIIEYKGYWEDVNNGKQPQALVKLSEYYKRLQRN